MLLFTGALLCSLGVWCRGAARGQCAEGRAASPSPGPDQHPQNVMRGDLLVPLQGFKVRCVPHTIV